MSKNAASIGSSPAIPIESFANKLQRVDDCSRTWEDVIVTFPRKPHGAATLWARLNPFKRKPTSQREIWRTVVKREVWRISRQLPSFKHLNRPDQERIVAACSQATGLLSKMGMREPSKPLRTIERRGRIAIAKGRSFAVGPEAP